jgi:flagellar FliJ protein
MQHTQLKTLIDLAQAELDEATRRLGMVQQQRNEAQRQLDALTHYRDEYRRQLASDAQGGMSAGHWRNFHQFIDTLDVAMNQQRNTIAGSDKRIALARTEWQQKKQKFDSYETLLERAKQRENVRLGRVEQRESDEFAAKAARLRAGAAHE